MEGFKERYLLSLLVERSARVQQIEIVWVAHLAYPCTNRFSRGKSYVHNIWSFAKRCCAKFTV
jgi:hypothetical protein